jgi:outer membrane protein OmpA-like peptidoglycan-associated protein
MNRYTHLPVPATALAACIVLSACVSTPPDSSLSNARAAVQSAAADPAVARYDAEDLMAAQKHLTLAEDAAAHQDRGLVDHESYLAIRIAKLSQVRADGALAHNPVVDPGTGYPRSELAAREAAAERANAAAAVATADAEAANLRSAEASAAVRDLQAQISGLSVEPSPRGAMLVLTDDYFDTGRAQLKPGAQRILDGVAQYLIAHPERRVRVVGRTADSGSAAFNLELSLHRAETVRMALVARGVDPARSEAVGYGPADPLVAAADSPFPQGVEILVSDSRGQIASR